MDPNATLAEIRLIIARICEGAPFVEDERRLAELVEALDGWISRGGFLPAEWSASPRRIVSAERLTSEDAKGLRERAVKASLEVLTIEDAVDQWFKQRSIAAAELIAVLLNKGWGEWEEPKT